MKQNNTMKLTLATLLASTGLLAHAQSAVLSEDFEGEQFPPSGWSMIDADEDGHCWQAESSGSYVTQDSRSSKLAISYTRNPANYTAYGAQDNWLVSPQIHVANSAFVLTLRYAAQDLEQTEPIELLISTTGTNVEDFTSVKALTADNGYEDDIVWNTLNYTLGEYAGKDIYIAIRHHATATYGLSIDNVNVFDQNAPLKPSGFTLTPGSKGALEATLTWTNPARTANGAEIGDFQVVIRRDNADLTVISEGLTAGESASYTDRDVTGGTHSYSLAFRNESGTTDFVTRSAYIGQDIPKAPANVRSMLYGGKVRVTWDAVTAGISSGYIDPDQIAYTVMRDGNAIAENVKGTTYFDTPSAPGTFAYTVKAVNTAGESGTDYTSASTLFADNQFDVTVYETASQDNYGPRAPIAVNSRYSVSQAIYYPEDLRGAQGAVTDLVYKSFLGASSRSANIRVYIAPTTLSDLADKWVAIDESTKVFEGSVEQPQGTSDMVLHLDTPYNYTGGNLIVTVVGAMETPGGYADRFWTAPTKDVKRTVTGDSYSAFELSNLPYGTTYEYVPMTRFIMTPNNFGAVTGTVKGSDNQKIADAKVTVEGYDYLATSTDAEGTFSLPFAPTGNLSVTVSATGYTPVTNSINVTAGQTSNTEFTLPAIAKIKLSGRLVTDDTHLPAVGAKVTVTGYDSAETTADENGNWEFNSIFAGQDYSLTAIYPLYDAFTAEVNTTADKAFGDVTVTRSVISPWGVNAEIQPDGSAAVISWESPMSRQGEPKELSLGDCTANNGFGGDYYSTSYNIGHYYSAETVSENSLNGLSLSSLKGFMKKPQKGAVYACVWKGDRNEHTLVARSRIADADFTADGSWIATTFDEPVEFAEGSSYIVGYSIEGIEEGDKFFGVAPNYKSGVNNLKWSETEALYNAYNGWNIIAGFTIPGASGAVTDNPDVPGCEYNVWRRTIADDAKSEWVKVNATPTREFSIADDAWATLPCGTYQYAVSAIYHTGESAKAYGAEMLRNNDYDAALTAFVSPKKSKEMVSSITVEVTVTNLGEKPLSNIPVSVTIAEGKTLQGTVDATLNHGESANINLGTAEIAEGVYTLVARVSAEGDQVAANDELQMTLPNMANITLYGYRWNAYGNAGLMSVESNAPESAAYLKEITPNDALITAGEYYDGKLYAFTATWYGKACEFVAIDHNNLTLVSSVSAEDYYVLDMAYNYPTNTMWMLCADAEDQYLATVDITTGEVVSGAPVQANLHTLACSTEGQLYAITADGKFVSVNGDTGAITEIGDTGFEAPQYLQSMAFDHNSGRLFWAAENRLDDGYLHEIDPATGKATALGHVMYNGTEPSEVVALYTPCSPTVGLSYVNGNNAPTITADGSNIIVRGARGERVTVTDIDGRVIATLVATGDNTSIATGRTGIVIAKAGTTVAKLILK